MGELIDPKRVTYQPDQILNRQDIVLAHGANILIDVNERAQESDVNRKLLLAGLIASLFVPSITLGGFRCKKDAIVQEGDTKSEVEIMCGSPMSASYEGVNSVYGEMVYVDRWIYNPGKGRFYVILDFHDGVLKKIENGPRVKQKEIKADSTRSRSLVFWETKNQCPHWGSLRSHLVWVRL